MTDHKAAIVALPSGFEKLHAITRQLRAPDGCAWDREQTPQSMRGNVIEEAYELVDAINQQDSQHICEELGDLFLLPTMIAVMYAEAGDFGMEQIFGGICDKLIRRHPHVFGDVAAANSEAIIQQWNEIKVQVEGRRTKDSVLDKVKQGMPPLERAYKLQKVAAAAGFDWESSDGPWDKMAEELAEARSACQDLEYQQHVQTSSKSTPESTQIQADLHDKLEDEIGDLLFSLINVARKHQVDPALALHRSMEKFGQRFRHVEKRMQEVGETMEPGKLELMDSFWEEAKSLD